MIPREFVGIAIGNLWRMKLRTALTVVGVTVGIGALVSMLSFGFGVQKSMHTEFRRLGLFRTLQVLPGKEIKGARTHGRTARRDSTATPRLLDSAALDTLAAIPGVSLVYPQQSFEAQVTLGDTTLAGVVQSLPMSFIQHRPFGKIVAGRFFATDSAREAVVATSWVKRTGLKADSLVGRSMRVATPGSAQMLTAVGSRVLARYGIPPASIERGAKLLGWLLAAGRSNVLQVKVVGVAEVEWGFGFRMGEILMPAGVVRDLDLLPFGDPMELLALSSGTPGSEWPMIIVTIDQERDYARIKQEIEHHGFATLSFPEQLERLRKNFLVFDAFVALLGFIALFVAALGIANTMIMSILERTREIGILKSLGAEDGDVRALFLAEAAAIGVIGSVAGIFLGLGVSRLASALARTWMVRQDIPVVEMFYLPPWVALAAVAFGTVIAVLAGLYPASRAARIDPVRALRHD